ncbi:ATP-binding protein [Levilinea saccharolytica]|uniref:histidine kinase n=1 Tax=Levilinea saccharolytica TaxID=229921 RepID=A0A0P6XNB5_9CHLR|nr:ATP-binding protein [Levilinea saccharolytica]KPL85092.1 hypothetical protein ADN01_06900 [Levilinea saccharolytica]GAP18205.1 protein containing PAS domain S-box [Levilinea saccharolytica]
MSTASPSTTLQSFLRGSSLTLEDVTTLLNLMQDAAVVCTTKQGQIVAANQAFLQWTAFSELGVMGKPVGDLASGLDLNAAEAEGIEVRRARRAATSVNARLFPLGRGRMWTVVVFEESKARQNALNWDPREIYTWALSLLRQLDCENFSHCLEQALGNIQSVLPASHVCIYEANSQFPRLIKTHSCEASEVFPAEISTADLLRLTGLSVWRPGKRVSGEIHRAARIAGLDYVVTMPLGLEGGIFGLFVAAGMEETQMDALQAMVEFIAGLLSLSLQLNTLLANLRSEQERSLGQNLIRGAVFDNIQEGVVVISPDLTIQGINPSAEMMLGYADWEVWQQPVENILIGPEGLIRALQDAVERGVPTLNLGVVSVHRRDGLTIPAHIQTFPVQRDEDVTAVLVVMTDVSEHEETRIRTQQLEHRAMLGDITAIFAHEVRNPLNNISMGTQVLAARLASDDPNQDVIQRIQGDCGRLEHLMESVLSSTRSIESSFKRVDVQALLQRILDRWQPRFSRVNVRSFFQAAQDVPDVFGDSRSLEQVFTNLISNAVEVMGRGNGGTLAIHVQPSDAIPNRKQVEITVSDNGPGIPEDLQGRLFEPFVSHNPRGTGLGLAITKRIVTAHRGSIQVNSFPGGTVFTVLLPAMEEDGE